MKRTSYSWQRIECPDDVTINDVIATPRGFCAIGDRSTVLWSADDGFSWKREPRNRVPSNLSRVRYCPVRQEVFAVDACNLYGRDGDGNWSELTRWPGFGHGVAMDLWIGPDGSFVVST